MPIIEVNENIGHTFILRCEECGCRVDTDIEAFRDGSHVICADCCKFQDVFQAVCDYIGCEGDSRDGRWLKAKIKAMHLKRKGKNE